MKTTKFVLDGLTQRKKDGNFAQDIVNRAKKKEMKLLNSERPTKPSDLELMEAGQDIQHATTVKTLIQSKEYYFKIPTHDSVEAIFGQVFTRYL